MNANNLPSKVFSQKELKEEDPVLVIGYNETLLQNLPPGTCIIDPSLSKTKAGFHNFPNKTFLTKDLKSFSLGKTFPTILSHNTLHLCKDLKEIMIQIQSHLTGEAIIYFPLKPISHIQTFLADEKWKPYNKGIYQIRDRVDIEEATLAAPFSNILIEEKIEHFSFFSENELLLYLKKELKTLTSLNNQELEETAKDLSSQIYKIHDKDQILSLPSSWILLTLSNDD
ncbi:MAG: hypothetical protein S4CHLAM20_02480 [Chlamydiia bacterium]|nr:hypothetical protein [Chlamydiia bacterium]